MSKKRRKHDRPYGERSYPPLFVIAAEGAKTEPEYFSYIAKKLYPDVAVDCLKGRDKGAPPHLLRRMKNYLKKNKLNPSDQAWLVVDRDNWLPRQLDALYKWSSKHKNYGFALSNPKFEYWLLLHFEEGKGVQTSKGCSQKLKKYLPSDDKSIEPYENKITKKRINDAISRAKSRDKPPCKDWPRNPGVTTVYKLVKNIIQAQSQS